MIQLTSSIAKAKGIIPAITLKSAEILLSHLQNHFGPALTTIQLSPERILTHTNPHLDDYMAALMVRALLPESHRLIPLEETAITNATSDTYAKAAWPSSILIGLGRLNNGGAKPLLLLDEHVPPGQRAEAGAGSVTQLIRNRYLGGKYTQIPQALNHIIREINHIDAHGGAHPLNLGRYIMNLNRADIVISKDSDGKSITNRMDTAWKEASINACLIAVLKANEEGVRFWTADYWEKTGKAMAEQSYKFYRDHSTMRDEAEFNNIYSRSKQILVDNVDKLSNDDRVYLKRTDDMGNVTIDVDSNGNKLRQQLLMPYLASLCVHYWGEKLANIILAPFWEAQMETDFTLRTVEKEITNLIDQNPNSDILGRSTAIGTVSLMHTHYSVIAKVDKGYYRGKPVKQSEMVPVVLLEVTSTLDADKAMKNVLNERFHGAGYALFRSLDKNNNVVMLSKGEAIPMNEWHKVTAKLFDLDGSSTSPGGKWYMKTPNMSFILNGTAAHKYVPKADRTTAGFFSLIISSHNEL